MKLDEAHWVSQRTVGIALHKARKEKRTKWESTVLAGQRATTLAVERETLVALRQSRGFRAITSG